MLPDLSAISTFVVAGIVHSVGQMLQHDQNGSVAAAFRCSFL